MSVQIFHFDDFSIPGVCNAIYQCQSLGESQSTLDFYYQNVDLTTWTPSGEIRTDYLENTNSTVLATFSFDPLTFGSVTVGSDTFNATTVRPKLTSAQTLAIPSPPIELTSTATPSVGINVWVYDIKLTSPTGEVLILARGHVQVVRNVTA